MISRLTGPSGSVTVGPMVAATLGPWTLQYIEGEPRGTFAFEAEVRTVDAYWITKAPHDLKLAIGRDQGVWCNVQLTYTGGRASGVVRAEQRRRSDGHDRPRSDARPALAGAMD